MLRASQLAASRAPAMADPPQDDEDQQEETRTRAVVALAIVLALAIIAIVLVHELRTESQREDCLMSGRTNCAPIEAPPRQ